MRFLADAGISPRTVAFLQEIGHDAVHVRDIEDTRYRVRKLPIRR